MSGYSLKPISESSAGNVMCSKSHIRQKLLPVRRALDASDKLRLDGQLCENVKSLEVFKKARTVASYVSVSGEVDLAGLLDTSKRFVFPKVDGELLRFFPARCSVDFCQGSFGIPEPISGDEVRPAEIDLVLVPGVAFDRHGYRIGYGKGYYDRLLQENPELWSCGVCLEKFLVEEIPFDSWDERVNFVATERMIYKTEGEV